MSDSVVVLLMESDCLDVIKHTEEVSLDGMGV